MLIYKPYLDICYLQIYLMFSHTELESFQFIHKLKLESELMPHNEAMPLFSTTFLTNLFYNFSLIPYSILKHFHMLTGKVKVWAIVIKNSMPILYCTKLLKEKKSQTNVVVQLKNRGKHETQNLNKHIRVLTEQWMKWQTNFGNWDISVPSLEETFQINMIHFLLRSNKLAYIE